MSRPVLRGPRAQRRVRAADRMSRRTSGSCSSSTATAKSSTAGSSGRCGAGRLAPDVAVVCGRRRERHPETSVYNRLADLEWDTPVGEAESCGGDAMMRVDAFRQVGGFDAIGRRGRRAGAVPAAARDGLEDPPHRRGDDAPRRGDPPTSGSGGSGRSAAATVRWTSPRGSGGQRRPVRAAGARARGSGRSAGRDRDRVARSVVTVRSGDAGAISGLLGGRCVFAAALPAQIAAAGREARGRAGRLADGLRLRRADDGRQVGQRRRPGPLPAATARPGATPG